MSRREQRIRIWINQLTHSKLNTEPLIIQLKNGSLLCKLISKVTGKKIFYYKNPSSEKEELENLKIFIDECLRLSIEVNFTKCKNFLRREADDRE